MRTISIENQVQVIKALAHPARLEIAQALSHGERSVSELQVLVGGDLSTVSKHLTLMRKAGWIDCRKQGQQVRYRLACDCLPTFLRCVEDIGKCRGACVC
jgi:ArsR family transcriptional regulator